MKRIAVVQIKGLIDTPKTIKDTLVMINLTRANHCVIIDDRVTYRGMLQKSKDLVTWGEITEETVTKLIVKRGKLVGDKKVTDEYVKNNSKYNSIKEFTEAFMKFEAEFDDIEGHKKVFRLSPPRKGYKSTKDPVGRGGDLGNRGEDINNLLATMV